jgi:hypothetical protein
MLSFQPHDKLGDQARIKSVSAHPHTGKVIYHKASQDHWWSDTARLLDGQNIRLENERLYKVRWDVPDSRE